MGFIIGIMIGICICYWLKVSAQTKQELVLKNAEYEVMAKLAQTFMDNKANQEKE